jgi:hypothetical protein
MLVEVSLGGQGGKRERETRQERAQKEILNQKGKRLFVFPGEGNLSRMPSGRQSDIFDKQEAMDLSAGTSASVSQVKLTYLQVFGLEGLWV